MPSSPNTADKVKRKPEHGELPALKRSRHEDDDIASDEDRRKHRSRRAHDRDEDHRSHRKDGYTPSPERKHRDGRGIRRDSHSHSDKHRDSRRDKASHNKNEHSPSEKHRDSRRDRVSPDRNPRDGDGSGGQSPLKHRYKGGHEGYRVSDKKNVHESSPDRKLGDADVDDGRQESHAHRDKRIHEVERVLGQNSPSPDRIHREDDRRREHSSSPARKHRGHDSSPSPNRRHRNGGQQSRSPLHHRDRSRYDDDRAKERVSSRDDDRVFSRDARPSGRDDRVPERNGKVHGEDDRSKDTDRNSDAQVLDRDREGLNSDRRTGEKVARLDKRDNASLDRYVGDGDVGVHDKNDIRRQKQNRISKSLKNTRNEEEYDLAGGDRKRCNEDDKYDHGSSRRSRENDRHIKHKSWVDMVEEDELATKKNKRDSVDMVEEDERVVKKNERDSAELNKHVNRHSRSKASPHETDMRAAGKENKDSKGNIPAGNASAEQPQGRSGGVYIPPFKLAQMMKEIQDKSGVEYQRMTWDALRKSINGLVNKVNASNIKNIIPELLAENLIRGRGLFARSCMKSQMASPLFTHVFAALVAVVNTKFPELGELLLKRVLLQFRRALKRNDKPLLLAAARFIAHLVNQQVAHEVVALEVLMVLLENPTDDSVEVSVGFVKECGAILQDLAPQGLHGIFERFRGILHEGEIDKRVQFMIEGLFAIRKSGFQGHPAVIPELDLVDQEDQFTHEVSLSEDFDAEMSLDVFKPDPNFLENEKKYEDIKRDILGEESSDDDDGEKSSGASSEDDEDDEEDEAEFQRMQIKDETETNLVNLRRTIYLTIMSSVDFEEAGHKLLKIKLEPGQEMELNIMLLECCSQERTYLRYYGLLGQRFCMINKIYQDNFDQCFVRQYSMIHRLETNKLRNVAKFFAHLLGTDALSWNVLAYIKLTEEDTTSSSRIFIKILFQELSEHLGLRKLNEKLNDPAVESWFDGIFPKDNPKNTRFAINFFTSIGLGGITDSLREHLKNMPRLIMQQQRQVASDSDSSDSGDTSESESSSSEDDSESSSSESESEPESDSDSRRKRKRR